MLATLVDAGPDRVTAEGQREKGNVVVTSYRSEHRSETRVPRARPASIAASERVYCGHSHDLSRGGAAIWVPEAPAVNARVKVTVELDDGPIELAAVVRRIRDADEGFEVGVEFSDPSPGDAFRLAEHLGHPERPPNRRIVPRRTRGPRD